MLDCLAEWRILQTRLVPLLLAYPEDQDVALGILKLVTAMTMPPNSDTHVRYNQHLIEYKAAMLDADIMAPFMELLALPLSHFGGARTEMDDSLIELVLYFFRNLLMVRNPAEGAFPSAGKYRELHEEFILILDDSMFLDACCTLARNMKNQENRQFAKLLLEIFSSLFEGQWSIDAKPILKVKRAAEARAEKRKLAAKTAASGSSPAVSSFTDTRASDGLRRRRTDPLVALIAKQKSRRPGLGSSRHSRFGSSYRVVAPSAAEAGAAALNSGGIVSKLFTHTADQLHQAPKRRIHRAPRNNKETIGADDAEIAANNPYHAESVSTGNKARVVLYDVAIRVLTNGYAPLMRALKKLLIAAGEDEMTAKDYSRFCRLATFLMSLCRLLEEEHATALKRMPGRDQTEEPLIPLSSILETMDMWSFTFVTKTNNSWLESKDWRDLNSSAGMLREMLTVMYDMLTSRRTELRAIGEGLRDSVFKQPDILDLVPRLLQNFAPPPLHSHVAHQPGLCRSCLDQVGDPAGQGQRQHSGQRAQAEGEEKEQGW